MNDTFDTSNHLLLSAMPLLLKQSREKIFIKDEDLIYRAASNRLPKWPVGKTKTT